VNALFDSDLLNFGTIIIAVMIVGGVLVALTMVAQSVWSIRRRHADQNDEQTDRIEPKLNEQEAKHLSKSA
jgi:flagellar basal body-associated protein FliL